MQVTAVLAFALGATASFTKVVRKHDEKPIGHLDMYMNSACTSDKPYASMDLVNHECYNFEVGYGSFFVELSDHVKGSCMASFWDNADCNGNIQWHSDFDSCAENTFGHALWSASLYCPNATVTH